VTKVARVFYRRTGPRVGGDCLSGVPSVALDASNDTAVTSLAMFNETQIRQALDLLNGEDDRAHLLRSMTPAGPCVTAGYIRLARQHPDNPLLGRFAG